jgi:predicted ATPase
MITRVRVKNFRSLADVDVTLGPLTVLVGRNGAGKSAFVDVLRFVRDALRFDLETAIMQRGGIAALRCSVPGSKPGLKITITMEDIRIRSWGEYSFVIESKVRRSKTEGEYRVKQEYCRAGRAKSSIDAGFEAKEGKVVKKVGHAELVFGDFRIDPTILVLSKIYIPSNVLAFPYSSLTSTSFYSIFPNILRAPQRPISKHRLADNGENLASVLQQIKKDGQWFPDLLSALNRIVGDVSDLRVRQAGGYLITELQHRVQNGTAPWFALDQESDGTLRILGLLVGLYHDVERTLIAIEEPELTLYPGVLGVLSNVLREASLRNQILITTQSPDLISRFGVNELRVVERVDGVTQIGPIDEIQRETLNEQLFSAGDLLRIEGLHRRPVEPVGSESA